MATKDNENLHTQIGDQLRSGGHRYTTGRRRVVTALLRAGAPVTIPQLLMVDDGLTQSSTYRNLVILEEVGVATRVVTFDDHVRYELHEHLTTHHHHLMCTGCGNVADFELSESLERTLEREMQQASKQAKFKVSGHRLDYFGTCAACSS